MNIDQRDCGEVAVTQCGREGSVHDPVEEGRSGGKRRLNIHSGRTGNAESGWVFLWWIGAVETKAIEIAARRNLCAENRKQ